MFGDLEPSLPRAGHMAQGKTLAAQDEAWSLDHQSPWKPSRYGCYLQFKHGEAEVGCQERARWINQPVCKHKVQSSDATSINKVKIDQPRASIHLHIHM